MNHPKRLFSYRFYICLNKWLLATCSIIMTCTGPSWHHLGLFWARFGTSLGLPWGYWGSLGLPWGGPGAARGHPGAIMSALGPILGQPGPSWDHLGANKSLPWSVLVAFLGRPWGLSGRTLWHLGALLSRPGPISECFFIETTEY